MEVETIQLGNITIFRLIEGVNIGSVEVVFEKGYTFIENIFLDVEHRHKGYLRKIIKMLSAYGTLECLPLPQHRKKFEHLGFSQYKQVGEDLYYRK